MAGLFRRRFSAATALSFALVWRPMPAAAQAFTAPKGVGSVTLAWQYVDNTGHRLSDGFYRPAGQSVTSSMALDLDYAVSDRLSATIGIPYVFAKYKGALPPPSQLPVDACRCWHSSFADFSAAVRYRMGNDSWAVTPVGRFGQPSHAYPYKGEAVVGKQLTELQFGAYAGLRLSELLPGAAIQGGYLYAFVEKAIDDIAVNRSNVFVDLGYAPNRKFYFRTAWLWQHTHGGLRFGSPSGDPFPPPGEVNTPDRFAERDRLLKVRYMQLAAGVSVNAGPVDLFASYTKYIWGRDAHNGQALGAGVAWYFGVPE